ncbi:hypothetical protein KGF56_003660 [Candida oxycetoniae]|uniref:Cytochrome P450 n=1 Tax=Candida oxycetoniae TaxID=497107 RepID=A0AAI9WWY7_9ASCO|nr:uncharacterized protein KGF56_003660 [Candida oxycetoniae]KAI3403503.2 hypothetical protein KGF56_003660 [Candida oxycetoniae]
MLREPVQKQCKFAEIDIYQISALGEIDIYQISALGEIDIYQILALGFISILIYYFLIYPITSPLWKVPGPYLYRISYIPSLNHQRKHRWIERVYNLHQQYGPLVILSPNELSVNGSQQFIIDIYLKNFPKSKFYQNFTNHGSKDNLFATLTNEKHLHYKKMITRLYSKSAIMSRENNTREILVDTTRKLVNVVHQSSVSGELPDIYSVKPEFNPRAKSHKQDWFNKSKKNQSGKNLGIEVYTLFGAFAMDVISRFELGINNGSDLLSNPVEREIIMKHRQVSSMGFWTSFMPQFWVLAATKLIKMAADDITKFQLSLYAIAEKNPYPTTKGKNRTTLETLKSNGLEKDYAYSFLTDNLFADVIDDLEKIDQLQFLNSLLLENSRVHASIPGAEPRIVDKEDYCVNGIHIPLGTTISCLPFALHREPTVFPNAMAFVPQRWLPYPHESETTYKMRLKQQNKFMMPFGKGIRMCLGMNLAQLEIKLVIANLYWHYSSQLDPDWCHVTQDNTPIKLGSKWQGSNRTDQEMMCMNDAYTTNPVNDECWLRWFEHDTSEQSEIVEQH